MEHTRAWYTMNILLWHEAQNENSDVSERKKNASNTQPAETCRPFRIHWRQKEKKQQERERASKQANEMQFVTGIGGVCGVIRTPATQAPFNRVVRPNGVCVLFFVLSRACAHTSFLLLCYRMIIHYSEIQNINQNKHVFVIKRRQNGIYRQQQQQKIWFLYLH